MAPQGSKYSCKLQNEDEVLKGQCAGLCTVASVEWPLKLICAKKMCAKEKYHLSHHFYWVLMRVT